MIDIKICTDLWSEIFQRNTSIIAASFLIGMMRTFKSKCSQLEWESRCGLLLEFLGTLCIIAESEMFKGMIRSIDKNKGQCKTKRSKRLMVKRWDLFCSIKMETNLMKKASWKIKTLNLSIISYGMTKRWKTISFLLTT